MKTNSQAAVKVNKDSNIYSALGWLHAVISSRFKLQTGKSIKFEVPPLEYFKENSDITKFLVAYNPTFEEFTVFLLALVPHLKPDFFTNLIAEHFPKGGDIPEFGGVKSGNHRGILPTGETAQFVIGGEDIEKRTEVQHILASDHWFARKSILWLEQVPDGEPAMGGKLILDPEVVELLVTGKVSIPRFSIEFPAEHIETLMAWEDLVLHPDTVAQIREIENWVKHNDTMLNDWGMKKRIKPGYRALFYGPPGTGKTLTVTLLGKYTGKEVFRIDLSRVVSKYIGETEKNLSRLFDKAENKNWILFFDEADALFGKRTDIRDAHDKYANQEVAYLLQRVENYAGLVILATNQRGNIDDAFIRRFHSIVNFPVPLPEERYLLWSKAFPPQVKLTDDIDWKQIAARFELTGANIMNVTHYCCIEILAANSQPLDLKRLEAAVLREYVKEGKVV